ncbi:MAG: glycosyltransferase family protein [Acidimicrobiales bacterium]
MTRFMIHSHDTYGLGHVRRCSLIAEGLVGADADNEVLITTGSPRAMAFRLSERVDSLKLPAATKDATGAYQPRKLTCGIDRLVRLRSDVLLSAAGGYSPDVILVDHAPIGMAGELVPLLEHIDARAGRPRLVLGLRDIIDDPSRVEADWHRDGVWEWLDCYDEILVYGDRRVLTTAAELDLAARSSAIVTHTGFVAPTMPEPMATEPFVLVTAGGGGDGQALLRRYLDAVEAGATSGIRSELVAEEPITPWTNSGM